MEKNSLSQSFKTIDIPRKYLNNVKDQLKNGVTFTVPRNEYPLMLTSENTIMICARYYGRLYVDSYSFKVTNAERRRILKLGTKTHI